MAYVKTREDAEKLPEKWFTSIERSREKAKKLVQDFVAIDQATSIVIGKLVSVEIDRVTQFKYPSCRLTIQNPERYRTDGQFMHKMDDIELFFVNKPQAVMSMDELMQKFPNVFTEVQIKIKKER